MPAHSLITIAEHPVDSDVHGHPNRNVCAVVIMLLFNIFRTSVSANNSRGCGILDHVNRFRVATSSFGDALVLR